MHQITFSPEDATPIRFADRSQIREMNREKEMILARLALSACLVVGTMASLSAPATAAGPTGIGGLNSNGGNIHQVRDRRGHHGRGHGRHYRGGRHGGGHHGGGHRSRGRDRTGAFIAGAIVGGLVGWSSGYGYPRAHHRRYQQHHRPYYAPRRHHRSNHYGGHSRRHYSYSDGGYNDRHSYRANGNSACHPVSKFGSWHGRPAKVGGTMCYNGHGRGYVVSGSRYLIHYR